MKDTAPTQDQAMCFYRAALPTARLIDRAAEPRAPARAARAARGASADEAALDAFVEAVRARDEGAGVAADLGQQLGRSASALKKTVDALVEAGRLVEKKKRSRVVAYTADGTGGGEDVEA